MGYLIAISIILIYSVMQTILFKKRIEQTIPISVVGIVLIIYLTGMFDNLKLGINIIGIMAIVQIAIILYMLCMEKDKKKIYATAKNVFTPAIIIYIILCTINILINKGRIFENIDEFNHWGRIIKNMYMYNTYGINEKSYIIFNEYPPFTAIFQYIFLKFKNIYSEDTVIIAQNILYLSIILPIFKNIKWDKSLKKALIIIPLIIFIPMIFYENFYLEILVDGILGVMFAMLVYYGMEKEESRIFKDLKIFSMAIMLCLSKPSGIALAVMGIVIIVIDIFRKAKKEKSNANKNVHILDIILIVLMIIVLVSIWYVKVSNTEKRWDFSRYIENRERDNKYSLEILNTFLNSIVYNRSITNNNLTVLSMSCIIVILNFYISRKRDKYYIGAMLISIPVYMLLLFITYVKIFDSFEAQTLACFSRYASTILLAEIIFVIIMLFCEKNNEDEILVDNKQCKKTFAFSIFCVFTIILTLNPQENIEQKYIDGKNYIATQSVKRDMYTKLNKYSSILKDDDNIFYIYGQAEKGQYLVTMNQYNMPLAKIMGASDGIFYSIEDFEKAINDYKYIYIYNMKNEYKEIIKDVFEQRCVENNKLYLVSQNEGRAYLKAVK